MLPSTKHTPMTPPSQPHQGTSAENCGTGLPRSTVVATTAKNSAELNEISAGITGLFPTLARRREFAAVWIGISPPTASATSNSMRRSSHTQRVAVCLARSGSYFSP